MTTQPLHLRDPRLRRFRVEAWIGEKIEEGRYREIAMGRFVGLADAVRWVRETYPDAEVVRYTSFSERDGWTPHALNVRGWENKLPISPPDD